MYMFEDFALFLDTIGYYGPWIVAICVIVALWKRPMFVVLYMVFFWLNQLLNSFLKLIFREQRPSNPVHFSHLEKYKGAHFYGMPSGHAESVGFSFVFLYLLEGYHSWWLYVVGMIMALTCIQRWKYRRHTVEQIMAGLFFGGAFAGIVVYVMDDYRILQFRKWIQ
jgi:membrane-associated phospholipid phosphatase